MQVGSSATRRELARHWRVLLGATLGASVSVSGMFYYTSSVFFAELNQALGWSRSALSLSHVVHTSALALLSPFIGAFMDRHGVRKAIIFSLCAQVVCYTAMGLAPAQLGIYLTLQASLALFGAASTPLGYSRVVSAHFDEMRGFALGIVISGLGLIAIIAPIGLTHIVGLVGWRGGYLTVAAFIAVIGTVGMVLMGRTVDHPRPLGTATGAGHDQALPLSHFLRQPVLWLVIAAFMLPIMFGSGYLVHLISMLRERGFSPTDAGMLASAAGGALLLGRLLTGWLVDRILALWVAAGVMTTFGLGLVMLASGQLALVLPATLAIGFAMGAELDLLAYLVSRYFGVANFGKLYGLTYGAVMVGASFSALLISRLAESTGDYTLGLWVSTGAMLISSALFLMAPPFPDRPRASEGLAAATAR